MKKLFTFVAAALFAISASADVIWSESLDKNGSYINKADFGNNWPFATQWYENGNFVYEYDSVGSYGCSVRNKKLNGDAENSIGFFFSKDKPAESNYLHLEGKEGAIVEGAVNCKLMFDICSSEANGGDLSTMAVTVNDETFPTVDLALGNKLVTSAVEFTLPDGDIQTIHISFNNVPSQKFIAHLRIEGEAGQAHGEGGITPQPGGDTPELPEGVISCADAVTAAASIADPTEVKGTNEGDAVKVRGYVTYAYNAADGKQSAWLSDTKGAKAGVIQAAFLTVAEPVAVGDYVEIEGTLAKYLKEGKDGKPNEVVIEVINGTMTKVGGQGEGIENVTLTEKAQKVMIDGVMYIVRDNKMYNAQGVQVR
jgi:hypothetical protein